MRWFAVLVVACGLVLLAALWTQRAATERTSDETADTGRSPSVGERARTQAAAAPGPTDAPGVRLDVLVVDVRGAPIPGARITASCASPDSTSLPMSAVTDAAGAAFFSPLPPGRWRCRAEAPGHAAADGEAVVRLGTAIERLRIVLESACTLDGRIRDATGAPIADAVVEGGPEYGEDRPWARATTEQGGAFRLEGLPPGVVSIRAARRGQNLSQVAAVVVPDVARVDLVLQTPAVVEGTVRTRPDGGPLADVAVVLAFAHGLRGKWITRTDAMGAYRFEGVPPGSVMVRLHADGWLGDDVVAPLRWKQISPGGTHVFDLGAERLAGGLAGHVRRDDGSVVPGARVSVVGNTGWGSTERKDTTADADGAFTFAGLAPGGYVAWAWTETLAPRDGPELPLPGYVRPVVEGALVAGRGVRIAAAVVSHDVFVVPGAAVAGVVEDPDGKPVSGALVRAPDAHETTTDGDGAFRLSGLPASKALVIEASHPEYGAGRTAPRAVAAGASVEGIRIVLAPRAVVRGRVVASDGGDVVDAVVRISDVGPGATVGESEWRLLSAVPVGADGCFSAQAPGTSGWVRVRADARGRSPARRGPVEAPLAGTVDLGDIALTPEVLLRGRVVAADDGSPVAGASITANTVSSDAAAAVTGADGRFEIHAPDFESPDDRRIWQIQGAAPGFAWASIDCADPSAEITLALPRGAVFAGRVLGPGGAPVSGMTLHITYAGDNSPIRSVDTAQDGTFSLAPLKPGTASVRGGAVLMDGSVLVVDPAQIAVPGPSCALTARLSSRIAGRVVDETGAAVPGIYVEAETGRWRAGRATDAEGRFEILGLDPGAVCNVTAGRGGEEFFPTTLTAVAAGTTDLLLRLERGEVLRAHFVDEAGQAVDIQSKRVSVTDPADPEFAVSCWGAAGSVAELRGLRRGRLTLWLEGTSGWPYLEARVPIDLPTAATLTVVLVRGGEVQGTVVAADGRPLGDVFVRGYPESARLVHGDWPDGATETSTDATGHFHLERLKPGVRYTVLVEGDEGSSYGVAAVAAVAAGTTDLRFVLARARTVSGRLLDVADKPVEDATIAVLDDHGLPVAWAATQDGGVFTMSGVPDRTVAVVARFKDANIPDQAAGTIAAGIVETTLRLSTSLPHAQER